MKNIGFISFYSLLILIVCSIITGLFAALLSGILHISQDLGFSHFSLHQIYEPEHFLDQVENSSFLRRILTLSACGLIAGIAWQLLYKYGTLISVRSQINNPEGKMPLRSLFSIIINAFLQVITVGLGSPLGRESAPRELGAAITNFLSNYNKLKEDKKIIIACSAGAGLAAVYNVPFSGALFTLEVLLCTIGKKEVIFAFFSSAIATLTAQLVLGGGYQYEIPNFTTDRMFYIIIWSLICAPFFGCAAYYFNKMIKKAKKRVVMDQYFFLRSIFFFMLIGFLSCFSPFLLGNGKDLAQTAFNNGFTLLSAIILLILKVTAVYLALRSGAFGGLLTPSIACGALCAIIFVNIFSFIFNFDEIPYGIFSIIGAAAFLASTLKMPVTASLLIIELTSFNLHFILPIMITVSGSYLCYMYLNRRLVELE